MIEGLERLFAGRGLPGVAELREWLQGSMAGGEGPCQLVSQEALQPPGQRVFRLQFACDGENRSVVVKRLEAEIARRNELVARRWLPAVGLGESCPLLRGSAAAHDGASVWQVFEDLGPWQLDPQRADRGEVRAAVELVARLHMRFAGHPLLGEVRLQGAEYGIHFYETNVRDAIGALRAVKAPEEHRALCERLLGCLYRLRDQLPTRRRGLEELGGPETLLHGDLWAINVFVARSQERLQARLIDWDHAGVGPISYDLSTFLLRFAPAHRPWVLGVYEEAVGRDGWQLPGTEELNRLFETAELARFANRIIWPAIALVQDNAAWGFAMLAEVEQWFEQLKPVLAGENEIRPLNKGAAAREGTASLTADPGLLAADH